MLHRSYERVDSTRCPVSAAASAMRIVSGSRISPTTITSGAWRSAARSAVGKSGASTPISTCSITLPACVCSYSIGSSMVTMWRADAAVDLLDQRRERRASCPSRSGRRSAPARAAAARAARPAAADRAWTSRGTRGGQHPHGGGGAAAFAVQIDAEPRQSRQPVGGVRDLRARGTGAARAARAPAAPLPRCRGRRAALRRAARPRPSRAREGGAPATSSRSLPPLSATRLQPPIEARRRCRRDLRRLRRRRGVELEDQPIDVVLGLHDGSVITSTSPRLPSSQRPTERRDEPSSFERVRFGSLGRWSWQLTLTHPSAPPSDRPAPRGWRG